MSDPFITIEVPPLTKEVCETTESIEPLEQIEIKTEVIEISDGNEDEEHVPVPKKKSTRTAQEIGGIIIETNKDQDTSNSRQTVRVRVDRNAAEHSRLYRERHRAEINKRRRDFRQRQKISQQLHTLCNTQNKIEIEIERIPHASSSDLHRQRQHQFYETHREEDMLKRERKLKKNAEHNLKYRERHRQEINERKRARLQLKKYSQQREKGIVQEIPQATSENQPSSHIQRQRRYYERHKDEINKRKRDSRLMKNTSQLTPATAAERNLKYQERIKEIINERRKDKRQRKKNEQQSEEMNETGPVTHAKNKLSSKQLRYYARHKEQINKRRRDNRQQKYIQQKETNKIEQVTTIGSSTQKELIDLTLM